MKTKITRLQIPTLVTNSITSLVIASSLSIAVTPLVRATTITNGFTYSVASDSSDQSVGTHYHSNTGGAFGNPAGKAEVGNYFSEEVRGLSEYNLAGLTSATSAFVTFNVFKNGGLFTGSNDFPFTGNIDIVAYQGNNLEDISDYEALGVATVGTFSTSGLAVGNTRSFNITSIFNNAIVNGWLSLGIRLQVASDTNPQGGAWTFDNFRLTTDNQSDDVSVPEPTSTFALLILGIVGTGTILKRSIM
jgi:hypothetical protein